MMTTTPVLTETQAQALECLQGATSAGVALSEHVRSRGLDLRKIYDAIAQLRRRGIVPPAPRRVKKRVAAAPTPVRFAKVEVRPTPELLGANCQSRGARQLVEPAAVASPDNRVERNYRFG